MKVEISPGVFLNRRASVPFAYRGPAPFFGFKWSYRYFTGFPPAQYLVIVFVLADGNEWFYSYGDGTAETCVLYHNQVCQYFSFPPEFRHQGGYYFNAILWGAAVAKSLTPPP